ncbi:MAG: WYL domain-containing protein, partial [Ilumatobacteraceae bacterium]
DRPAHLATVTEAVLGERRLRLRYSSWNRESTKTLDPFGLVLKAGCWYLVAATHAQHDRPATFRVDQMSRVRVLDETFVRPSGFELGGYWSKSVTAFRSQLGSDVATVRLSPDGAARCQQLGLAVQASEPAAGDGWVTATVAIESISHAHALLLQLGADVEVVEPIALRVLVATTARQLVALYAP